MIGGPSFEEHGGRIVRHFAVVESGRTKLEGNDIRRGGGARLLSAATCMNRQAEESVVTNSLERGKGSREGGVCVLYRYKAALGLRHG